LKNKIDVIEIYKKMQLGNEESLILPPPSFSMMKCEIIDYQEDEKSIVVKIPVLKCWVNPYNTMQGGLIEAAIDNAVGPLSLLSAPINITRNIETKFIKSITLETQYIYVHAKLCEQRKKRLTFDATVQNKDGEIFTKSKVINFII
jgi:acyl-coenzyme A thioesterase PaaI-like protein